MVSESRELIVIETFLIKPYKFQMARPFVVAGELLSCREGVIVEVIDRKGRHGLGEAAPLPGISAESLKKAVHQLKCLTRDWTGRSFPDTARALCLQLQKDLDRQLLAPSVIFAMESALVSLTASVRGISAAEFLGTHPPKAVRSACLIQGDPGTVRAYGAKYAAEGFTVFKLKVGSKNIPLDIQKVDVLREAIGFDGKIRLDANAAWSLNEAVAFASVIGKAGIDFIEEPCRDENDNEKFFQRTDMPWAIEAHSSRRSLEDWEGARGLKAMIIKPMLCGGINAFLAIRETAHQAGVKVIVSSLFESPVGLRILFNLAALTGETCGLGTADWTGPQAAALSVRGGTISPGLL